MDLAILGVLLAAGALAVYKMRQSIVNVDREPEPLVQSGGRVAVIGDSLSVGIRSHFMTRALQNKVSVNYQAKGGTTTGEWTDKLPDLHDIDAFVVVLGTNDAAGSAKHFGDSMSAILGHAERFDVPVVWVQPTGDHFNGYPVVMEEIESALNDGSIYILVDKPTEGYGKDNVHLSPAAYKQWAERIWNALTGGDYAAAATIN